ncbi:glycine zipper 2TM domain-containing protein [Chitinibacter fontanus]|uniref:glycine zipper 2TM domain-containing protein n=1 Tax=Chitinibacter fontanus TaxID=1737446 RepID=UPI001D1520D3|nr:glycine zipper 2TM domain-containing protein [Chitinibacter fontanus]
MRVTTILLSAILTSSMLLTGCITADSANVYKKGELKQLASARAGVIENLRDVQMDDSSTGVGSIAGAVIGGVAASSNIGKGTGAVISGVLGSILGGMLGNKVETSITRKPAKELTILMQDNGQRVVVVQDADVNFVVGQHVDVITDGHTARVVPTANKPATKAGTSL